MGFSFTLPLSDMRDVAMSVFAIIATGPVHDTISILLWLGVIAFAIVGLIAVVRGNETQ